MNWKHLRQSVIGDERKSILPPRVKLPVLSLAITKFSQRSEDPNASAAELGKIIETDSGLTGELMKHVNSSAFGLRAKASSARQAIGLLGIRESKLFLLSAGIKRAMRGTESKLINVQNFGATNLERGLFAREVALLLKADADLAFTAALLEDFLLPILSNQLFPTYYEFTKAQSEQAVYLTDFEKQQFGWDHALASAHVMLGWDFPDDLLCCVLLHHRGLQILSDPKLRQTAAAAVAVASLLPDQLQQIPDGLARLFKLQDAWPAFNVLQIAESVDKEIRQGDPALAQHSVLLRRVQKAAAAPV